MSISQQNRTVTQEGSPVPPLWLGYGMTGGRVSLRHQELKERLLISGRRADELTALVAYASKECGLKPLVLDIDGRLAASISGYLEPYDYSCFVHDAFQMEEDDATKHGQLLAAAYAATMSLDAEEEAIMMAAMHKLALTDNRGSPAVVGSTIEGVEGFRGFYVDKLRGRIAALKFLESAENGSFRSLLSLSGSVISFESAKYPQAAELAASAFLAKLLAILPGARAAPDLVIISGVHRIFRSFPRVEHGNRLLTELLDAHTTFVLSSREQHLLGDSVLDAFPLKIMSSDAWNDGAEGRWKGNKREPVLPNSYVISDGHFGHDRVFVARTFVHKMAQLRSGPQPVEEDAGTEDKLTRLILEDAKKYDAPTRESVTAFLSVDFGAERVERMLDKLSEQGYIKLETRDVRNGGGEPMLVYTITQSGERLLEMLSR
jgi:hypothetical protein